MNSEPMPPPTLETLDERPQQFGLSQLMIGVTLVAVICAILAPLWQMMTPGNRIIVVAMFVMQGVVVGSFYFIFTSQRSRYLRVAGRRIGVGYNGQIPGKRWPMMVPLAVMCFFGMLQLAIAIWGAISFSETISWTYVLQQAQTGVFGGFFLAQLSRGGTFASTEFFENGVMVAGNGFTPWERIQLRPSQLSEDRLVMITRAGKTHFGSTTATIFVDQPLREYLLAHYGQTS